MIQIAWIRIDIVFIQKCTFLNWNQKKYNLNISPIEVQIEILLLFHEFNGVLTSTRLRIDSAKFDVIRKHRTMAARPKLNSKFCAISVINENFLQWHSFKIILNFMRLYYGIGNKTFSVSLHLMRYVMLPLECVRDSDETLTGVFILLWMININDTELDIIKWITQLIRSESMKS